MGGLARWSMTSRRLGKRSAMTGTCSRWRSSTATTSNVRSLLLKHRKAFEDVVTNDPVGIGPTVDQDADTYEFVGCA